MLRGASPGETPRPVSPITGTHPGPVARAPGQGGPPGRGQRLGRLAFPNRDDPRDQPAVFGHVDRLATADPGQHLTRVAPQIPKTDGVRVRHHASDVSPNCGHNRWRPNRTGDRSTPRSAWAARIRWSPGQAQA
jgi:hypothetical protein